MLFILSRGISLIAIFASLTIFSIAQTAREPVDGPADWSNPYPPFRIAGNLYYVGTYDLASYLITTSEGHYLINTGLAASVKSIQAGVEQLGYKFSDIKILLTTQAHYDHLGAMAAIKKHTGAQMMVDYRDSSVVTDGGRSDYAFGSSESLFEPVEIDRVLYDKDTIKLGHMRLVILHHPGHTKGSCSYIFDVNDKKDNYRVLIANFPTIVTDSSFDAIPGYPEISSDYAYTLDALKKLKFDIWVASHASQFGLHKKRKPGDSYNPRVFADREGYDAAVNKLREQYLQKIKTD